MANAATEREIAKANALVTAWRKRYATTPTRNAVVLILSVAELETHAGDFRGAHNWGQVQRRQVTVDEKIQIAAGKTPPPRDASEILSTDTHPTATGPVTYSVWLWAFPDDVAGADKLLSVLLEERPSIKKAIDGLTFEGLAGLMYDSKYFEGSHPRNEAGGPAANIAAYAKSMRSYNVDALLFGWMPGLDVAAVPAAGGGVELAPAPQETAEKSPFPVTVPTPEPEADPFPAEATTAPATPSALTVSRGAQLSAIAVVVLAAVVALFHACGGH